MKQRQETSALATLFADFKGVLKKTGTRKPLPPNPKAIAKIQTRLLPYAPAELFQWLEFSDGFHLPGAIGGCMFGAAHHRQENVPGILWIMDELHWTRRDLVPIASDGCGQTYCIVASEIDTEEGFTPVVYVDTVAADTFAYYVSSTVELFLRGLLHACKTEDFEWCMDKKAMLARDPRLKSVAKPRLPWS